MSWNTEEAHSTLKNWLVGTAGLLIAIALLVSNPMTRINYCLVANT